MFELIQVTDATYYINCPSKIGILKTGADEVCFIDSGNDKESGRKLRQILDARGWRLRAIYCTHAHADHIGGNKFLQDRTGCMIYAPGAENAFASNPTLESIFIYGGKPPSEFMTKSICAQQCVSEPLSAEALPDGVSSFPLPGHSYDMVGYRSADDVVFLADCLASEAILKKLKILYIHDIGAHLDTLERLKSMEARLFVPSHTEAFDNPAEFRRLVQFNIDSALEVAECICALLSEPKDFALLFRELTEQYGISMMPVPYFYARSNLTSYLTWLKEQGRVQDHLADGYWMWETT